MNSILEADMGKKKKKEFKEDLRVTINYEINASLDCCSRNNLAALKDPTWNILIRLGPFQLKYVGTETTKRKMVQRLEAEKEDCRQEKHFMLYY